MLRTVERFCKCGSPIKNCISKEGIQRIAPLVSILKSAANPPFLSPVRLRLVAVRSHRPWHSEELRAAGTAQ